MKFTVDKNLFCDALATVKDFTENSKVNEVLRTLYMETEGNNKVTLIVGVDTRVKVDLQVKSIEEIGHSAIPAVTLFNVVKQFHNGEILVSVVHPNICIEQGEIFVELRMPNSYSLPHWEEVDEKNKVTLLQEDFKRALKQVLVSVPSSDPRPNLLGSYFIIEGRELTLVGTNGKILTKVKIEAEEKIGEDFSAIIPIKLLKEVSKDLEDFGEVSLTFDGKQVQFYLENVNYIANIIERNYVNYEAVIPRNFSETYKVNVKELEKGIKRASKFAEVVDKSVCLFFEPDKKLAIKCFNESKEVYSEEIHAEAVNTLARDFTKITFNSKFLLDILKVFNREELEIKFNSSFSPVVFCSENLLFMVMPLKKLEVETEY